MQRIIIQHKNGLDFNILDITNQKSSGWWKSIDKAEIAIQNSDRELSNNWPHIAYKNFEDVISYLEVKRGRSYIILNIINTGESEYEYW